jgi:hypothetical protein
MMPASGAGGRWFESGRPHKCLSSFWDLYTKSFIYFSSLIFSSHITRTGNNHYEDAVPTPMSDLLIKLKHSKQLLAILVKLQVLEYPLHFLQMSQDCVGDYSCIIIRSSISVERKILDIPVLLMKMAVDKWLRPHRYSYSTQAATRIYIILSLLIAESRYGRRYGSLRITKNANFAFLILIHFLIKACARIVVIFIFIFCVH